MGKRNSFKLPFKAAVGKVKKLSKKRGVSEGVVTGKRELLPCPPNLDRLPRKAYHNVAVSPLCRIPDELLLLIMGNMGNVDLASLRRTSRIFLRLFQDPRFHLLHTSDPSAWPRTNYLNQVNRWDLRARLLADKYCALCFEREIKEWHGPMARALCRAQLFCAGCGAAHSAGLFSPWERGVRDARLRACIAHEGHLRVCQHRVVTWADIQRWSGFLSPARLSYMVLVCGAQSHLSQCGRASGKSVGAYGVVVKLQMIGPDKVRVIVEWGVHVSVPHRKGSPSKYDADDVRNNAEELHADAGQHIIPRFQPDVPPHMAAFDPNFCSCLNYPGRGSLDWQMVPEEDIVDCCRKSRSRALFTSTYAFGRQLGVLWGEREAHIARYEVGQKGSQSRSFRIAFNRCCAEPGGMGVVVMHRHSFLLTFRPAMWPAVGPPTSREPDCVPPEWYRVMDPASYGLEGDAASRHFLWCEEEKCANHVNRAIEVDRFRDIASLKTPLRLQEF